jgi:hypothetical protein
MPPPKTTDEPKLVAQREPRACERAIGASHLSVLQLNTSTTFVNVGVVDV